jgi:hypothetical protein
MPSIGTTLASTPGDHDATSLGGDGAQRIGTSVVPGSAFAWPVDTDLIYIPGSRKIMLTLQMPLICMVIQDAFENLRASLLFEHAFPDPNLTVLFIRKNLIGVARSHLPRAMHIHKCLLSDDEYLDKLSPLVSGPPSIII